MTKYSRSAPNAVGRAVAPMLNRRRALQLGGAALGMLALGSGAQAQSEPGIVQQIAPELKVPDWTDEAGDPTTFSMADSRGKWVFLKCFQNWCPGCHSSGFPTLVKVQEAFGDNDGLAMAAIQTTFEGFSTNTADKIPELRERYGLRMPIGHDEGDPDADHGSITRLPTTMRDYRTGGTPWLVLVNPAGVVAYNGFHADPDRLIAFLEAEIG